MHECGGGDYCGGGNGTTTASISSPRNTESLKHVLNIAGAVKMERDISEQTAVKVIPKLTALLAAHYFYLCGNSN